MSGSKRVLFLSLRPEYVDLILRGEKTVELRRQKPNVSGNDIVILYAASPVKSVLGTAKVNEVFRDSVKKIWRDHGSESGITRQEFDLYFDKSEAATAIRLKSTVRLSKPVCLSSIRKTLDGFHPPQSFRYLTMQQRDALFAC